MRFYGNTLSVNSLTGEIEMFSNFTKKPIFKAVIPDHDLRRKVEQGIRLAEKEAIRMAAMECTEAITQLTREI